MADRDERLAALLDELSAQKRNGATADLEAVIAKNPDLADELRGLWGVVQLAELARSGTAISTQGPQPLGLQNKRAVGDYELIAELGRGGMGVVYKAFEKNLQRFVALKMILAGEQASAEDLARFRTEAQAAAGLTHPNIVPVYNVGEQDGQAFFSMKFVEGQTLTRRLAQGPLPQRDAARIMLAVARGIQHAHQNGILHRDVKPSNILLDKDGEPHITDFGLAKRVTGGSSLTGTGAIIGTPSYMAPEQASGHPATPAVDIYSLGAILYELLTGRPPFLAASAVETLLLVRSEEPARPRLLNPQIDPDLELVCRKCLEKRPEHRYASAQQLADDLQAYLNGEPVSARTSSLVYFVTRLLRESHHAPIMEHWGGLWIWHSVQLFLLCAVTSWLHFRGFQSHWTYLSLWSIGLVAWGIFFWSWRRRAGPVTFVERQIAHAWGAGVAASIGIFIVEVLLGLPALLLSPVLAVIAGVVFLVKAGTLSGWFYIAAAASFLIAIPMAILGPGWGVLLFGLVSAMGFFVPGMKYYKQAKFNSER